MVCRISCSMTRSVVPATEFAEKMIDGPVSEPVKVKLCLFPVDGDDRSHRMSIGVELQDHVLDVPGATKAGLSKGRLKLRHDRFGFLPNTPASRLPEPRVPPPHPPKPLDTREAAFSVRHVIGHPSRCRSDADPLAAIHPPRRPVHSCRPSSPPRGRATQTRQARPRVADVSSGTRCAQSCTATYGTPALRELRPVHLNARHGLSGLLLLGGGDFDVWFYRALVLLVIGCPCALVISAPVSIVASMAEAARNGVLVKGGTFIEVPATLRGVALDKDGHAGGRHP